MKNNKIKNNKSNLKIYNTKIKIKKKIKNDK